MAESEQRQAEIDGLVAELTTIFNAAIASGALDDVPDDSLGQLFASVLRAYAAKIEAGEYPRAFARNSGMTATDAMIGCTAILQAANLKIFDLGHWQSMETIGKRPLEDIPEE
jgi:hypothetical protein